MRSCEIINNYMIADTIASDVIAKYQNENKLNLNQWIRNGIPLKIERWVNGKYYVGPDAEWSTCMVMTEIKLTNPILELFQSNNWKIANT